MGETKKGVDTVVEVFPLRELYRLIIALEERLSDANSYASAALKAARQNNLNEIRVCKKQEKIDLKIRSIQADIKESKDSFNKRVDSLVNELANLKI